MSGNWNGHNNDDADDEIAAVDCDGETAGNEPIVRKYHENNLANYAADEPISRQRPNNLAGDMERKTLMRKEVWRR